MRLSVPPNASDLARSGSVSQEPSAKSIRTRSGLFGFFRPQKTVSPLTQQATQDLPVAKPRTPPQIFRTEDHCHDSGIPAESGSAWSTLPEHLIENVMEMLQTEMPPPMHHSNKTSRQVCRLLLQSVALFSATQRLHLKLALCLIICISAESNVVTTICLALCRHNLLSPLCQKTGVRSAEGPSLKGCGTPQGQ